MFDIVWTVCAGILLFLSLVGCFLPILPGPPIGFIGLLVLQLRKPPPFDTSFLVIWFFIVIALTILDYLIPIAGAKKYGGSTTGLYGSLAGLIIGMFFPPVGIILGPMLGAIIGELITGKRGKEAVKSGIGTFFGFLLATLIKVIACSVMCFYFVKAL